MIDILTDAQFIEELRRCWGIFSEMAKEIKKKYGIACSKEEIIERALNFPEVLYEILDEWEKNAERNRYTTHNMPQKKLTLPELVQFIKQCDKYDNPLIFTKRLSKRNCDGFVFEMDPGVYKY